VRPLIRGAHLHNGLWAGTKGCPLNGQAIYGAIAARTRAEFGHAIGPHLFRHCAATTIAILQPERIGVARDLLGHASLTTTNAHYNKARSIEASRHYAGVLARERALIVDLDQWASEGVPPPPNQVPRISDGTLVPPLPSNGFPQSIPNPQTTLPATPSVVYNGILHTGDLWDFGPQFDGGIVSIIPPDALGTPYQIFVPKTDSDGNDIAGIRVPSVVVPVATYTGWGLRAGNAADPVPIVDGCDATG
jgi:hypothetical protein